MSDLTLPSPRPDTYELILTNRKLTTAVLGMVLLSGLIACMSYLAGRTVSQIKVETVTPTQTVINPPPLVVEPKSKPSPAGAAVASPMLASAPQPAPVPAPPSGLYLQVGLVDPVRETYMQDRLSQLGYKFRLAPMESSLNARVLVGPISSLPEMQELQTRLTAHGYQHFPRRW
ncbi:MAG: hypothetical protein FJW30_24970 [Acidobacteria bacterium]|nr:hypothetical protein [Acidobacteriota bacterium]